MFMKKITTILLACATAATVSAAGLQNQVKISDVVKYSTPVKMEKAELKAEKNLNLRHSNAVASSRAGVDISGNWVGALFSQESVEGYNNINMVQDGETVKITNFWNATPSENITLETLDAEFVNEPFEFSDGTYDSDVLKLAQDGVVGTYKGRDVTICLAEIVGQQYKLYTNQIEYIYDEEYNEFWLPFRSGIGVALITPAEKEGYYSILDFCELSHIVYANATIKAQEKVSDTEYEDYTVAFYTVDVSGEDEESSRATEQTYAYVGFCGMNGLPFMYIENGEATFYDQTAGTFYYNKADHDLSMITSADGENASAEIIGTVAEEGSKQICSFENIIFYAADIPAVYMWLDEVVITLGENGAGINSVGADIDNSNAPVVYYNLQGQLVKEPAAGQIVIRKQGTEATKVLVK